VSEEERRIDRLWWRAWSTNRKMEVALREGRCEEWRDLAWHLVGIEDELERFVYGRAA